MEPTSPRRRKLSLLFVVPLATALLATSSVAELPIPSPADEVSSTASATADAASDTASGVIPSVSDTASGATGTVRERLTTTALGTSQNTRGSTPSREDQDVPCDPETNTCGGTGSDGGTFAATVGRMLNFLAQTGFALLGWIAMAVGLGMLGIFLLRSSKSAKRQG
jgi:hypothetical protein